VISVLYVVKSKYMKLFLFCAFSRLFVAKTILLKQFNAMMPFDQPFSPKSQYRVRQAQSSDKGERDS